MSDETLIEFSETQIAITADSFALQRLNFPEDILHIADEGQIMAMIFPDHADAAFNALNLIPRGEDAVIIGNSHLPR